MSNEQEPVIKDFLDLNHFLSQVYNKDKHSVAFPRGSKILKNGSTRSVILSISSKVIEKDSAIVLASVDAGDNTSSVGRH